MRLDASYLQFITKQQLRILVAIQIGMKNHQFVPLQLISSIGNLRSGQTFKTIKKLLKNKLIVHVGKKNNGYKLTYLGYDYLALNTFMKRGIIKDVICKIGVGKQSDIYKCQAIDGSYLVLKLTRLGRRSFKTIKNNRQYIQNRTNYNWLYLSRLSSIRQFTFMQILFQNGFPTPRPIDTNRHAIVMSLIDGDPLCNVKRFGENCSVKKIFLETLELVCRFATKGLIHGDFNQFNLLINTDGKLTVIDFPQCVSTNHPNAQQYFNRDIQCLYTFFNKMLVKSTRDNNNRLDNPLPHNPHEQSQTQTQQQTNKSHSILHSYTYSHIDDINFDVSQIPMPILSQIKIDKRLDLQVKAKGHFKLCQEKQLDQFMKQWNIYRNNNNNQNSNNNSGNNNGNVEGQQIQEQEQQDNEDQIQEGIQQGAEIDQQQMMKLLEKQPNQTQHNENIQQNKHIDENDEDLKQLMNQLKQIGITETKTQQKQQIKQNQNENQHQQGQQQQNDEEEDDQQQQQQQGTIKMREQWKNLTAFQIRQILKQQRKKQREKKKQQLSTEQYIKKALGVGGNKKTNQRTPISRGNYGAKIKNKVKSQSIKDGLQMGW